MCLLFRNCPFYKPYVLFSFGVIFAGQTSAHMPPSKYTFVKRLAEIFRIEESNFYRNEFLINWNEGKWEPLVKYDTVFLFWLLGNIDTSKEELDLFNFK